MRPDPWLHEARRRAMRDFGPGRPAPRRHPLFVRLAATAAIWIFMVWFVWNCIEWLAQ